jgi:hypothetical protein
MVRSERDLASAGAVRRRRGVRYATAALSAAVGLLYVALGLLVFLVVRPADRLR